MRETEDNPPRPPLLCARHPGVATPLAWEEIVLVTILLSDLVSGNRCLRG